MAVYLPDEKKKEIFKEFGGDEKNTGSTEGQIALLSYRVKSLSKHLHEHKKDQCTRRALLTMVGKRKRLLAYLKRKDLEAYRAILKKLELRG